MAILTWAALRTKLTSYIKGESTGSLEKTKAVEHREFSADFIDTVESKITEVGAALPNGSGATGDVQLKKSDGKLIGSSSFNFLSGLLTLVGNFVVKGLSASVGNALEVKNLSDITHLKVTNDGFILGGTTVARVGFNSANYSLYQAGSFAVFLTGVLRMELLSTGVNFSVPISVNTINGLQNVNSTAGLLFRSANGTAGVGFDIFHYAGRGGTSAFKSGNVLLGYRQQNGTDVNVLSIQERTPNSTDGVARILFAIKEVHADNAAAISASLPVSALYRTPTGEVRTVI